MRTGIGEVSSHPPPLLIPLIDGVGHSAGSHAGHVFEATAFPGAAAERITLAVEADESTRGVGTSRGGLLMLLLWVVVVVG